MDSQNQKLNVLIIGATGNLGSLVTKHCLTKPNLTVNILVRDPQKNKELTASVEKAGGKVLQGDVSKPDTLKGVTKGMHTLIFTLPSFGEDINLHGQIALINDGVEQGVQRVVPNEYSENFTKFAPEELAKIDPIVWKRKVKEHLKTLPVKTLSINAGIFIDTFFGMLQAKELGYWGDVNHKFDLTSYENTARFIAAAVARKDQEGALVYVANSLTIQEAADAYNKVRGTNLVPKHFGSLDDLKKQAEELEKTGDHMNAFMMRFLAILYDNRTKFDKTNNDEFPEVERTTVEEFLRENPGLKIQA